MSDFEETYYPPLTEADEPDEVLPPPPMPASMAPATETLATEVAPPAEMTQRRNPNDVYAFGAMLCALLGFIIPIVPATAALMLVRATEGPLADVPLSPSAQSVANAARTVAYVSLTLMIVFCAALLLGILGRVISS